MSKAAELAKMGEVLTNSQIGGRRNLIINGAYQVAQRGTSNTNQGASEGYKNVDRWNYTVGGTATAGRFTLSQDTSDAPTSEGFGFCTKFDCTTADTSIAAGEALIWRTKLEGGDLQAIKKGTSSAEKITLSFYAKGTAATYAVELHDEDNSRHNTQKFTVTTSWQRFELTFAADTTGAFNNDHNASLGIAFWLHGGSDYTGGTFTSNTWASRTAANVAVGIDSFYSSTDNEFFITGVQLEIGSQATPFEHRPYGDELDLCHRYFEKRNVDTANYEILTDSGTWTSSTAWQCPVRFKKVMRTAPTITNGGTLTVVNGSSPVNITSFNVADNHHGRSALLYGNTASGPSAGQSTRMQSNSLNAYIQFDAEL